MATTLIVGESRIATGWAMALEGDGHVVETNADSFGFQERFAGEAVDVFIVDITCPDGGEAMLIPQARAIWPGCRTIAITPNYAFRSSAVYKMGLWSPDQLLIKPVGTRVLCATVAFLWAQVQTERIKKSTPLLPRLDARDRREDQLH